MRRRNFFCAMLIAGALLPVGFLPSKASAEDEKPVVTKPDESQKAEPKNADDAKKKEAAQDAPKEKPVEPAKPPAGANPLQKLFQQLIPPRVAPPVPMNPRIGAPNVVARLVDPDARDHIDARVPKDRRQSEQLRKASAAIDSKDWPSAIDLLQIILSQDEDSVDRLSKSGYGSVRERAMQLMLKLPEESARTFRQKFATDAQRLLDEAIASGRPERLTQVAMRFLLLEPGQDAANRLGDRHLDRGELYRATAWFRLLSEVNSPITKDIVWRLKGAMAAKLSGDLELAERLLNANSSRSVDELVEVGGKSLQARDWLASLEKRPFTPSVLQDWTMLFGSAKRSGTLPGGEPLLLQRWTQPLTQLQPLQRQLEMLAEDCVDQNRATVMVAQPLLVDGLLAMRTLSGVQVFELEKGRRLWTSGERWPAEELIGSASGQYVTRTVVRGGLVMQNMQFAPNLDFTAVGLDQNPLAQLFYSHGNFGQLSSDGRQLFAIEDETFVAQNAGYWGNSDLSRQDPLRRNWSSNKLVSYDLRSGRPLWAVGGVDADEVFQPELPGVFFFGAPVHDGNELLVIGERDAEIRLFCLQAATGKPIWTQLLATAELGISRDFWRRQFAAQVAISDGVIVCPTTVGWLVGVDRATHQLLWLQRYSNPQPNNQRRMQNQAMTVQSSWGQRWAPSAPMIVGDSVVYAPQEFSDELSNRSGHLICLNLQTGERRWDPKSKDSWVAVNGVASDNVLLVGANSFGAIAVKDGNPSWTVSVNGSDGAPSGLGVVSGDRWHVPLTSGQLLTVSLKNGEIIARQWGPPEIRLGNLSLYRGAFLSAHPTGLTCFEQREAVVEQIRRRKESRSNDPLALLLEASIARLERRPDAALVALQSIPRDAVPPELSLRYRDALRDALSTIVESRPHEHSAELKQLEELIASPDDRVRWQRLKVTELREQGNLSAAFELLVEMSRGDVSASISLAEPSQRSVRLSTWLGGQFENLWTSATTEDRKVIDSKVTEFIQKQSSESLPLRRLMAELFGFHPATREMRWRDIDELLAQRDYTRAELALLEFSKSETPTDVARAWQRLVELQLAFGIKEDASVAAKSLSILGDVPLADDTTTAQWLARKTTEGLLAPVSSPAMFDWSGLKFRFERSFGYTNHSEQTLECQVPDGRWPFFLNERFQYQQLHSPVQAQRLVATSLVSNQLDWSLPLRQKGNAVVANGVVIRTTGHQMLVLHRDILHLLSPVDRRVVWTRQVESRGAMHFDPNQGLRRQAQPMLSGAEFVSRPAEILDDSGRNPIVVLCSPKVIVYRGRRSLTALETVSGETLWTIGDLPNDARIVGTHDVIHVTSNKLSSGLLLRVSDGQELPLDDERRNQFSKAKMSLGADLLLVSRAEGTKPEMQIERWNPLRQSTRWKQVFNKADYFQWLDSQSLVSIEAATSAEMTLKCLDTESGQQLVLGTLKNADFAGSMQQRFAIADRDRVFLVMSGNRTSYYSDEFVSIPINGSIIAFDRHVGGELWREKISNQGLVVQQFASNPVLLLTTRRIEQKGRFPQQLANVTLIDKKTGRKLLDETFPNQYGGYRSLSLNLAERQLELQTFNERIRLIGE